MGTHPIFESDFDCLTDMLLRNRLRLLTCRANSRIEGLNTNLSILAKSKGTAPITLECIDLIAHPSADVALFEFCPVEGNRVQERSGSEIDIHAVGDGVTGQISVYSKVKVRAENGTTTVSSLEAPAIDISSDGGDIELNGIKIANSILGEAVKLRSKTGDIRMKKRTLGDVMALTHGNVTAGTVQSLRIDIRGNNVQLESAYAGSGIIRAHNDIRLKNLNGDFDVEAGHNVMIDGCDGSLELVAQNEADIHLDSSVKRATIKAKTVTIRTPPSSNGHRFTFVDCGKVSVDNELTFEKLETEATNEKQIVLLGENSAGHERKVKYMEFAGEIRVESAERVHLKAESWMAKQLGQAARFGEAKQDDKMAEQKGFRFY